ncbi:hypothetical protein VARIO8X_140007 [Burkholderiales bacterium 8X]|nr:hypothetical protein VARIO8X_140007 [Burkholderiales bacterium 8X]
MRAGRGADGRHQRAAAERSGGARQRPAGPGRLECLRACAGRPAGAYAALPAVEPLLRGRQRIARLRLGPLRPGAEGLGPGAGYLRFRAQPSVLRLPARPRHPDRPGCLPRAGRRVPRLHAPRDHALPLHEHSGALLHRLPRRHRRARGALSDGFQRLVRGVPGRPLAHLRCAPQHAAHRPHRDRPRPGRGRRADHDGLRRQHAAALRSDDRRGPGRIAEARTRRLGLGRKVLT